MSAGSIEAIERIKVSPTATISAVVEPLVVVPTQTAINIERWNGLNTVKVASKMAISRGVSENTIVLLLLLPLLATLISVLHYIFGFSGYGIFIPSMIAVSFLATGLTAGLLLFAMILVMSLLSNMLLRRYRLHFWPSRAINLVFISIGTLGLMLGMSYVPFVEMNKISIFPILLMVLLSEEFVRTQLAKSRSEAKKLTLGTLVLAAVGAGMMSVRLVQDVVLSYPELCLFTGLLVNLVVGNYSGIRLSEIKRFGKAIRKKEVIKKK
jgi:hypothetical protein